MVDDSPAIAVAGLSKRFGDDFAVQDVTFDVPRGSIFGYVGPSGSGKTTTIKLLLGLLRATHGDIEVLGRPPAAFGSDTRSAIGYMPQSFSLYPTLTVRQNLAFAGRMYGLNRGRRRRMNELLEFVELSGSSHKLAANVSGGMQRRLSLAATLLHDPELIFFDEPTAGVDPVLRRKFWDGFRVLQEEGRTLFVTTQYVSEVENCDVVGVMLEGGLIAVDTPEGLRKLAYGGDALIVESATRMSFETIDGMAGLPFVKSGPAQMPGTNAVRIVVDDAKTAMPELLAWAQAQGLTILSVEPQSPAFDDVFVELIRASKGAEPAEPALAVAE